LLERILSVVWKTVDATSKRRGVDGCNVQKYR